MVNKLASRSSDWPPGEDRRRAFGQYTAAVGKAMHAWGNLHEILGQLFVVVTRAERSIALAIWYSTESCEAQRRMLSAAVKANTKIILRNGDFKWFFDQCNELSQRYYDVTNAPSSLYLGNYNDGNAILAVSYIYGHPRANNLSGRKLLVEFDLCERYCETLALFAAKMERSLASSGDDSWPHRPRPPTSGLKKIKRIHQLCESTSPVSRSPRAAQSMKVLRSVDDKGEIK